MKLKIYKHNSIKTPIDDDIAKINVYFQSAFVKQFIDVSWDIDIENTNKDYKDDTLFKPNEGVYDVVMVIYEKGAFLAYGDCQLYSINLVRVNVSVNPVEDNIDYSWKVMCHELVHALWFMIMVKKSIWIPNVLDTYFKNDDPYAVDGNFANQLKLLKPYYMPTTKYKYFKESEVKGLKPELVSLLDKMRGECGFPFIINSGFRTVKENLQVGGVEESAHLTGEAVDLKITDSNKREKLIKTALLNGINRIGVAKTFIHLDISKTLPQNVMWLYN